jgi:hypothetical protein
MNDSKNLSANERTTGRNKTAPGESGFDTKAWAQIEAEFGTGWVPTLAESLKGVISPLDTFQGLMTDASQNTYTYVTAQMKLNSAAGGVAKGMGAITGQFTLVSDATGKVVKTMNDLNTAMGATVSWHESQTDELQGLINESKAANPEAWEKALTGTGTTGDGTGMGDEVDEVYGPQEAPPPAHWSKVTESLMAMFAAAGQQIREGLKSASTIGEGGTVTTSDEYKTALADYNELTKGGTQTVLEGIREKFEDIQAQVEELPPYLEIEIETRGNLAEILERARPLTTHEIELRKHLASLAETTAEEVETQSEKTVTTYISITALIVAGYKKIASMIARMKSSIGSSNKKKKNYQHGGMINEPIWGIGESGTEYTLGEAGPEMVTPMGKGVGGIGPVTINVNVDSINSDVDLEKIKPIVERALLEVHSRRGII